MTIINPKNFILTPHFLHLFRKFQVKRQQNLVGRVDITELQITCTDLMLILAEVDVYDVFYYNQYFFLLCACLKNMGGFMKWGVRYKTAKKRLKKRFSSCRFCVV